MRQARVTQRFHYATLSGLPLAFLTAMLVTLEDASAQEPIWDNAPTKIDALIALDVPGGAVEPLIALLPAYLNDRSVAVVGPAWNLKAKAVTGALRKLVLKQLTSPDNKPSNGFPDDGDKLLLLAVRRTTDGFEVTGREYDRLVERWSALVSRKFRQQQALAELLFEVRSEERRVVREF